MKVLMISIIQRAFYSNGTAIAGKPAAAVAVCRRGGVTAAFETLNLPFQMMDMPIVTSQYWNIVYGREPGQAALDIETISISRKEEIKAGMDRMLRNHGL